MALRAAGDREGEGVRPEPRSGPTFQVGDIVRVIDDTYMPLPVDKGELLFVCDSMTDSLGDWTQVRHPLWGGPGWYFSVRFEKVGHIDG